MKIDSASKVLVAFTDSTKGTEVLLEKIRKRYN